MFDLTDYLFADGVRLIDVLEGPGSLSEAVERVAPALDQDLVLFMGPTGAGKSTLINYLLGHALQMAETEAGDIYLKPQFPGRNVASMGVGVDSCTLYPEIFAHPMGKYSLCDLPGFFDTRGTRERIVTNMSIDMVAKGARQLKGLVIVIEYDALYREKGRGFRQLMETLKYLFKKLHESSESEQAAFQEGVMIAFNLKGEHKTLAQISLKLKQLIEVKERDLAAHTRAAEGLPEPSPELSEALAETALSLAMMLLIQKSVDAGRVVLLEDIRDSAPREQFFKVLEGLCPINPQLLAFGHLDPAQQEMNDVFYKVAGQGAMCMSRIDCARDAIQMYRQAISELTERQKALELEIVNIALASGGEISDIQKMIKAQDLDLIQKRQLWEQKQRDLAVLGQEIGRIRAELASVDSAEPTLRFEEKHSYSILEKSARLLPGVGAAVAALGVMALAIFARDGNVFLRAATGMKTAVKKAHNSYNIKRVSYSGGPFNEVKLSPGLRGNLIVDSRPEGRFIFDIDIFESDMGDHYVRLLTEKRLMPGSPERIALLLNQWGMARGLVIAGGRQARFDRLTDELGLLGQEIQQAEAFLAQSRAQSVDKKSLYAQRTSGFKAELAEAQKQLQVNHAGLSTQIANYQGERALFDRNVHVYQLVARMAQVLKLDVHVDDNYKLVVDFVRGLAAARTAVDLSVRASFASVRGAGTDVGSADSVESDPV